MRHKTSLEYAVLCGIILKFLFVLCAKQLNATESGKSKGDQIEEILKDVNSEERLAILQTHFKKQVKSINEAGFRSGFINATVNSGSVAFDCAITSIKSSLEKLSRHPQLYEQKNGHISLKREVKYMSSSFSETDLAIINQTHDEWIYQVNGKMKRRKSKRLGQKTEFIPEIELTFGRCLYLMEHPEGTQTFEEIVLFLKRYFKVLEGDNNDISRTDAITFEKFLKLKKEFCGSIARSYHLANAIHYKHLHVIKSVTQPTKGPTKDFHDSLLDEIPSWYLRHRDITFINMFRYAYAFHDGIRYDPIKPYCIRNRYMGESGHDLVVIPLLFNSTECGAVYLEKSSTLMFDPATFHLDQGKTPKIFEQKKKHEWNELNPILIAAK